MGESLKWSAFKRRHRAPVGWRSSGKNQKRKPFPRSFERRVGSCWPCWARWSS